MIRSAVLWFSRLRRVAERTPFNRYNVSSLLIPFGGLNLLNHCHNLLGQ